MTGVDTKIGKQLRWRVQTDCGQSRSDAQLGIIDTEEKALRASYLLVNEALQSQAPYQQFGLAWLKSVDAIHTGLRIGDLHLAAILTQPTAFFLGWISGSQCELTQRSLPLIKGKFREIFTEMLATQPSDYRQLEMLSECLFQFVEPLIGFPTTQELASSLLDELSQEPSSVASACIRCMTGLQFHQAKPLIRTLINQPESLITAKLVSQITELMQKDQYLEHCLASKSENDTFLNNALCKCFDQLP